MDVLEAAGFSSSVSAASLGVFDVIAWNGVQVRFIQVKSGSRYASAVEREAMALCAAPPNATKEIWRWPDRAKVPLVEVL